MKINGTQTTALSAVRAQNKEHNTAAERLEAAYNRQKEELRLNLAKSVLAALRAGVPQSQISREGLGYNHQNGIRVRFNLPMSGNVVGHLDRYVAELTGSAVLTSGDALIPEADTSGFLVYEGEPFQGQPTWNVERDGVLLGKFVDASADGMIAFQRNRLIESYPLFTVEERSVIWRVAGFPDYPSVPVTHVGMQALFEDEELT